MYREYRQALRSEFLELIRRQCRDFCEWWWVENPATANIGKPSPDEAVERIQPLVRDAVDKMERFGIPYLDEYLKTAMRRPE